ncbi:hypothetical protein PVAND_016776 [Polypedilum vanderplanki]|uniref:Uncharacterized protein n=1 Tax=Polypedilum vanderplanki TaxID=319348 RepID=A0A9J6BHB5_POLVA|nr:hypothetical protein PVAND_016776 [Polypedilum vanderplanki]
MSSISSSKSSTQSFDDDRSEEIQKFIKNSLIFTPRRFLFEEFNENLEKIRNQQKIDLEVQANPERIEKFQKFDVKFLHNLSEFRLKNASECMSQINYQRLKRASENEAEFLKHTCVHRYKLNDRLIPVPVKSNENGQSLCLMCGKVAESGSFDTSMIINESKAEEMKSDNKPHFILDENDKKYKEKSRKKFYENSMALMYQKMNY